MRRFHWECASLSRATLVRRIGSSSSMDLGLSHV
jgi:hypothetical protein